MMRRYAMRRYAAEFLGTFGIVFAPVALAGGQHLNGAASGLLTAAVVSGLAVSAMVFALGPISAAHFNPAVTVGFVLAKRFPWRLATFYVLAQIAGAVCAAALCAALFGAGYGTHVPLVDLGRAIAVETVLTFLLMLVIMAVATDKRVGGTTPGLAIGLTVVFDVLIGGPISGGSMNPARSFGPALFDSSGDALRAFPVYLVGPLLGAILAGFVYERLRPSHQYAQNAPNDLFAALQDIGEAV